MNLKLTLPTAAAALIALAGCSSGDVEGHVNPALGAEAGAVAAGMSSNTTEPALKPGVDPLTGDTPDEATCLSLIRSFHGDLDFLVPISSCRRAGFDPVWNGISIYTTDADYEKWIDTGDAPTCDDLPEGMVDECKELRDS